MKPDKFKTDVVFRVWPQGDVIAIMPGHCGDYSRYTCESYMNVGQHGACDPYGLTSSLRLATPSKYKPLARELRKLGYRLRIIKRIGQRHLRQRQAELRSMEQPRKQGDK